MLTLAIFTFATAVLLALTANSQRRSSAFSVQDGWALLDDYVTKADDPVAKERFQRFKLAYDSQYPPPRPEASVDFMTTVQVGVSLAILACSLYIILSQRASPQEAHWAYASVGTILGFWLRGT